MWLYLKMLYLGCDNQGPSTNIFLYILGYFLLVDENLNPQLSDPRASLLLTSEKANVPICLKWRPGSRDSIIQCNQQETEGTSLKVYNGLKNGIEAHLALWMTLCKVKLKRLCSPHSCDLLRAQDNVLHNISRFTAFLNTFRCES